MSLEDRRQEIWKKVYNKSPFIKRNIEIYATSTYKTWLIYIDERYYSFILDEQDQWLIYHCYHNRYNGIRMCIPIQAKDDHIFTPPRISFKECIFHIKYWDRIEKLFYFSSKKEDKFKLEQIVNFLKPIFVSIPHEIINHILSFLLRGEMFVFIK